METKNRDRKNKEIRKMLMKKDEEFEQWWKENFCDSEGKPQVFISIYKNTLDFKNYCKLAWEEARKKKGDELGGDLYTTWEGREDE